MSNKKEPLFNLTLFKRLLAFVKPYKIMFWLVLTAVLLLSLFSILRPIILKKAIDTNVMTQTLEGFLPYILLMIGVLFIEVVFQFLFVYYASWLGQHVVKDIRVKLFKHILRFKMKYYNNSSVGLLITRSVTDMERIADVFGQGLFMIFKDILTMLVVAGFMLYENWKMSLIVFIMLPIIVYATKVFQIYMKKAFEDVRTEISNLNSFVQEHLSGMKIVQIFAQETNEYKKFEAINKRHKKAWLKTVWYNSIFFPIAELSIAITTGLVVWYGGKSIITTLETTAGALTAFVMMIPMLFRPLRQMADKFNTLQMGMVAAKRVFNVFDTNSKIEDNGTTILETIKGDIVFNNVHFNYIENEPVLKGISFAVKPGQTIAIVGSTGAGKSTIINLLNRFYEIQSGVISIDNHDIKTITLHNLRKHISVVLQDVFLFSDTILNNITLGNPNITQQDVEQAAKTIGIHNFIISLPNGYNYNVKERGAMLSSGQRQLIAFLRAYVANPSILVLDEATSSVDSYSEQLIQQATKTITKGRTSIVIAHRLATIKQADTILVMDAGNIAEQGTHNELLKIKNGYYKALYDAQFKEALAV